MGNPPSSSSSFTIDITPYQYRNLTIRDRKHVRSGTFGQFASFGLGSNTMDDATTLAAESDEENDSEPNSDEENDSIPNSDSEGRSD